jgi:hypothetical protein
LLAEGRATMARVTEVRKRNSGEHRDWRVFYEWTLLSGALRSAHADLPKRALAVGMFVPLLYDRDDPARHSIFPMSLVRVNHRK